jgi:cation diffusion facilitator CzcD-associated flavoprotein CzcO
MIIKSLRSDDLMSDPERTAELAAEIFAGWLTRFGAAMEDGEASAVVASLADDPHWKDILSFTWSYETFSGAKEIEQGLLETLPVVRPRQVVPSARTMAPRFVERPFGEFVEGFFDFETEVGRGVGLAQLVPDFASPAASRAAFVLTTLQEIRGHEEKRGPRRPSGKEFSHSFGARNWRDHRLEEQAFSDRQPQVLIVGAGHAGLSLAARLRQMDVDALIVERTSRVGDVWRNRYESLALHNELHVSNMPYIPFPDTWPAYLVKDKLGGWLEAYASFMELNIWSDTEFLGAEYDDASEQWTVQLCRNGVQQSLVAPHLVLATGTNSGLPRIPDLSGQENFAGDIVHSSRFRSGADYTGKHAVVIGTGNSGHDLAQDLQMNGAASVTLVQRSPTLVISQEPSLQLYLSLFDEATNEEADLMTQLHPYVINHKTNQILTQITREMDKDLLDGLHAANFETSFEDDESGFYMRYFRRFGGYYINVGCSELIIEGKIKVVQNRDIESLVPNGVLLRNGSQVPADVIFLATGFENVQQLMARYLGDDIADKVGPSWGIDEKGRLRNMWIRTAQDNLWVTGGGISDTRLHSRFLALQLRAALDGQLPRRERMVEPVSSRAQASHV